MSLSLRTVLPGNSPISALAALPTCASPFCPRPPTLWQRWWARHEGVRLDQRWYCSLDCFQVGLFRRLEQAALAGLPSPPRPNRLPLGLILLSQGNITSQQLREALAGQRAAKSGKLGEWLIRMGAVGEAEVTSALAAQQGCPLFPLPEPQAVPAKMYWPEPLVERYRAVPVFHNPRNRVSTSDFWNGWTMPSCWRWNRCSAAALSPASCPRPPTRSSCSCVPSAWRARLS
jgi:hypothetical protein